MGNSPLTGLCFVWTFPKVERGKTSHGSSSFSRLSQKLHYGFVLQGRQRPLVRVIVQLLEAEGEVGVQDDPAAQLTYRAARGAVRKIL